MPLIAIACALPVALALFVATAYVDVPMYDEWIWSPFVLALHDGTLVLADLWAPQGAHRSFFPTALALGLAHLDGWNVRIEALVGIAFAAIAQVALWRLFRRRLGSVERAALPFLLASLLLYSIVQSENWLWGFQLSWFMTDAGAVVAIVLLDGEDRPWLRLLGAIGATTVASFSLIFGFAAWIAGAVVLLAHRAPGRSALWIGCGALAGAAFLHGYALPRFENGWVGGAPSPLGDGLAFVLVYLGAPLGIAGGRWGCELLGTVLLLLAGGLLADARARGRNAVAWAALLVFALIAATMEAVGRAGNGVSGAMAFRYTTPSSLAWIALIGLLAQREPSAAAVRRRSLERAAWSVAALLFVAANAAGAFEAVQLLGMQHAAAAAFRDLDAHDDEELAQYENDPDWLRAQAAKLQAARLGPWRDPRFSPRPISPSARPSASPVRCVR